MRGTFHARFWRWSAGPALPAMVCVITSCFMACSDPLGVDGDPVRRLGRMSSRPAWSQDGQTIYYTDRSGSGITDVRVLALDTKSGRTRVLTSFTGLNHAEQVRTTDDPSFVLASIAQPDWSLQLNLYHVAVSGGAVRTIATDLGTPWFVASSDGRKVAYQGSRYDADTIYVASTDAPFDRVRLPASGQRPRVVSLSPTGSTLIYDSSTGLHLVGTDGSGHSRPIVLSSSGIATSTASQVLWSGDTPHLLVAEAAASSPDSVSLNILDVNSGIGSHLSTLPRFVGSVASWQLAWSGDGLSHAVWMAVSVLESSVERTVYRCRLYVSGPAGGTPVAALELDAAEPLTWFEFSRDGRQLALLLQGTLYVVRVE